MFASCRELPVSIIIYDFTSMSGIVKHDRVKEIGGQRVNDGQGRKVTVLWDYCLNGNKERFRHEENEK